MGDEYIAADPRAMKRKAQQFDQQADALAAEGQGLSGQLGQIGNCWGSDKTGRAFEAQYKQNADQLVQSIPQIARNIHDIAKGIRAQAKAYDNTNGVQ